MLQIKNIIKEYTTGDLTQTALNDVSFNLRDNEFVAILGQSGSGKTTLLNVIGGLDRYDSGDIIINGVSTKKYKDRDWDSYRNHTIGFVFQSYNLIPHQSILSNVELALTISGVSKNERKRRATDALKQVGLGDQVHKRPNQMSGGQMQRVAIARALVNDPDILLADEPTGALDSETSVQVMGLLREVAKDRLVVMVTHNAELANEYVNRIIRLHDGKIVDDSNSFTVDTRAMEPPKHKNMGKSSMSFWTALTLSFNNLRTKKGRTLLTSFAGSIGIIGIALILALSSGVNVYIGDIQKDTMTSYPITIEAQSMDISSLLAAGRESATASKEVDHPPTGIYSNSSDLEFVNNTKTSIKENNLTEFKKYLDNKDSEIYQYVGENGIVYSYDVKFTTYAYDPEGKLVNTDGSDFEEDSSTDSINPIPDMSGMPDMGSMAGMSGMPSMPGTASTSNFEELLPGAGDTLISATVRDNYEVLYGDWPQAYNEVVLVLDANNEISTSVLYELGLLPADEYKELLEKMDNGEEVTLASHQWSYEEFCNQFYYSIPASDYYVEDSNGLFKYIGDDVKEVDKLLENSIKLKITGVIRPIEDASYSSISGAIGYTKAFTDYLIDYTDNSDIVKAQKESPDTNILSGVSFVPKDDAAKIEDTIEYLSGLGISEKAVFAKRMIQTIHAEDPKTMQELLALSETELAARLDYHLENPDDDMLLSVYDAYISPGSYKDNMSVFGVTSPDAPATISIYADSFEDKDEISACIDDYNASVSSEFQISYTDYVGLLMSSITTIINVISYVLIAFVAVSLVVSSIMLGIITYISVLERTKEIGILRAIGASKSNI